MSEYGLLLSIGYVLNLKPQRLSRSPWPPSWPRPRSLPRPCPPCSALLEVFLAGVAVPRRVADHGVGIAALSGVACLGVAPPRVDGPRVVFAALSVDALGVLLALASVACFAEPRASAEIAVAFDALVPVSAAAVQADSPGRPRLPCLQCRSLCQPLQFC